MPRSASLRNYFELLPRDLTGDYIRQVLCSHSKGAEGNEVLVLGAWGCGAFKNPTYTVAMTFKELLQDYHCFEVVEFAIGDKYGKNFEAFNRAFK